jgi:hypothetical protein
MDKQHNLYRQCIALPIGFWVYSGEKRPLAISEILVISLIISFKIQNYLPCRKSSEFTMIDLVNEVRPQARPNIEVFRLADDILNLEGELVRQVWDFFYS